MRRLKRKGKNILKKTSKYVMRKIIFVIMFIAILMFVGYFVFAKINTNIGSIEGMVEYKDKIVHQTKVISDIKEEMEEERRERKEEFENELKKYKDVNNAIKKGKKEIYNKDVNFDLDFNSSFQSIYKEKNKLEEIMELHGYLIEEYLPLSDKYEDGDFSYKTDFMNISRENQEEIAKLTTYVIEEVFEYHNYLEKISTVEGKVNEYKKENVNVNLRNFLSKGNVDELDDLSEIEYEKMGFVHKDYYSYNTYKTTSVYYYDTDFKEIMDEKVKKYQLTQSDLDNLNFIVLNLDYDDYVMKVNGKYIRSYIDFENDNIYFNDVIFYESEEDKEIRAEKSEKEYEKVKEQISEVIEYYILKKIVGANVSEEKFLENMEMRVMRDEQYN